MAERPEDDAAPAPADDAAPARPRALGGAPWRGIDAAEAHRATLGELGAEHWPVLPELPDRGPGADATGRSAALLAEVGVDLQPHGWRVSPPSRTTSGMDRRRALSWWEEDAHRWADTAGVEGTRTDRLAVRVRGPLTLLGELWLPGGERVLVDAGARRDLAEAYRAGLTDALARLRTASGAERLGVVLDEPRADAVLAGDLPTASGYRTVRSLPRDEARGLWRAALADLAAAGAGDLWLDPHAADGRAAELAVLAAESLPGGDAPEGTAVRLVLDVAELEGPGSTPRAWDVTAGWADAGRRLTLRGRGEAGQPAGLLRTWDRLGLDPALARRLELTAPAPHDAQTLARLRGEAEELDARVGELLG